MAQSCLTLCNCVPTGLLCPWGFSRQEYWNGLPVPSPGDLSRPRDRTRISCVGGQILYHLSHQGSLPLSEKNKLLGTTSQITSLLLKFSHSVLSDSANPQTAARQASLSFTISRSLLRLMATESVIPSDYAILPCHPTHCLRICLGGTIWEWGTPLPSVLLKKHAKNTGTPATSGLTFQNLCAACSVWMEWGLLCVDLQSRADSLPWMAA